MLRLLLFPLVSASVTDWCGIVEGAATADIGLGVVDRLGTVTYAMSNCVASQGRYETLLMSADSVIAQIETSPAYSELIDRFYREVDPQSFGLGEVSRDSRMKVATRVLVDRLTFITPFDSNALLFGVSSLARKANQLDDTSLVKTVMKAAAGIFKQNFNAAMFDSPAYLTNNWFDEITGRSDLRATLVAVKQVYPKVNADGQLALRAIAGALRLSYTSVEAGGRDVIGYEVDILQVESNGVATALIARLEAIMEWTDDVLAGKATGPEALVDLEVDDLSMWPDFVSVDPFGYDTLESGDEMEGGHVLSPGKVYSDDEDYSADNEHSSGGDDAAEDEEEGLFSLRPYRAVLPVRSPVDREDAGFLLIDTPTSLD